MRHDLIEPPTPDQVTSIIRSALHQADERAVAEVAAHFMADRPLSQPSPAHWIGGEPAVRDRWRTLVTNRRNHLLH